MLKPNALQDSAVDPLKFDALLSVFNRPEIFEHGRTDKLHARDLAEKLLPRMRQSSDTATTATPLQDAIEAYPQPCLAVSETGQIVAINRPAFHGFDLEIADPIDDCGIIALEGVTLSERVKQVIGSEREGNQTLFCRATYSDAERPLTLAIVPCGPLDEGPRSALVFAVDIGWDDAISKFISQAYKLSLSEQEIIELFILGKGFDEIAKERGRSLGTVRTQFYSALGKCGLASQVDLVREVVAGSMFQSLLPRMANSTQHPHRKELRMLRPGGRTLDVVMSGDFEGTPVFMLAAVGVQKFSPKKDKRFYDASVCVYSISPPGYGSTSPPTKGADRTECLADDVVYLLEQLELASAPFFAVASSLLPTIKLANVIPDRITGILSFITIPPTRYQRRAGAEGTLSVIGAMGNAAMVSPMVKNVMTRAALRAWAVLGTRKMAKIQANSEPSIAPYLLETETLDAIEEGFKSSIRQGFESAVVDAEAVHTDWFDIAADCSVPITLVHGQNDKTNSILSVRDFANDFPDLITLVEVEDGGSFLHLTHEDVFFLHLQSLMEKYPAAQRRTIKALI